MCDLQKREEAPGCLRDGGFSETVVNLWLVVGENCLSEAAILVLLAQEPLDAGIYPGLREVVADSCEARNNRTHGVNKIHSPTALPRAMAVLSVLEVGDSVAHGRVVLCQVQSSEPF